MRTKKNRTWQAWLAALLLVVVSTVAPRGAAAQDALPPGIAVIAVCPTTINSSDTVAPQFVVSSDVRNSDGEVVIAAGAPVETQVTLRPRRRIGRPGSVSVRLLSTVTVTGETIALQGSSRIEEEYRRRARGLTIGMLFLYPGVNFLHLLHRGFDVELPGGFMVRGFTAEPPSE